MPKVAVKYFDCVEIYILRLRMYEDLLQRAEGKEEEDRILGYIELTIQCLEVATKALRERYSLCQ